VGCAGGGGVLLGGGGGGGESVNLDEKHSLLYFHEALTEIPFSFNNECRQKINLEHVGSKKFGNFNKSIHILKI
jgi:hypothetical protein